jgi:hypothetical protein
MLQRQFMCESFKHLHKQSIRIVLDMSGIYEIIS